jgi:hypothetical protein
MPLPTLCRVVILLVLAIFVHGAEAMNPTTQRWLAEREALRKDRQHLVQGAAADRKVRAEKAAKIFGEIMVKTAENRQPGQDEALHRLLAGLRSIDPAPFVGCSEQIAALPSPPTAADPKLAKAWSKLLEDKRLQMTRPSELLGQKALQKNVLSIAHECLEQVLAIAPDHAGLRKGLRQVKIDGRWYGPREQEIARSGLRWDDKLGWILAKERERYANGAYYDFTTKNWTTMAQADADHANRARQWVIQTEHLEIRGTARLADLVDVANRIEAFYDRIFGVYSGFFAGRKGQVNDVQLIFGMLDHPRLVLNVARDKEDYAHSLPAGVEAGWSDGMFIPGAGASYFYAGPTEVVYHEFTHQVLRQFTGTDSAPVWAVEGVAVYSQVPEFHDGRMVLGRMAGNSHLRHHLDLLQEGKHMPIAELLDLESHAAWSRSDDPGRQYAAAGMFVQFCMESENRRWREDFIDYLREAYRGESDGRKVWLYLGIERSALEEAYTVWQTATAANPPSPIHKGE